MAEGLNSLPNGWELKALSEVFRIKPPKSEVKNTLNTDDMVSFVPMNCLGILQKNLEQHEQKPLNKVLNNYTYFSEGDVLLAKITPCFENGKLGVASGLTNGVGFGSSEFIVFRSKGLIIPVYLFYYLSREAFRIEGKTQMFGAVGHKRVSKDFVEDYLIPYPKVIAQERIVGVLDEAFEGIATATAQAEKNLQNARELFQSVLQSTFSQKGDDWEEAALGDEVDFLAGFAFKSKGYTDDKSGIKLLRGDNIIQGRLRWEDVKRWPANDVKEYLKFELKENDVVLAMDRPWVSNGLKLSLMQSTDLPCLQVQRTARLRVNSKLHYSYLFYLISSPPCIQYLLGSQTGIGVPHISGKQILSYCFLRPSLDEQQTIVKKLDALSEETKRLETISQRKLDALAELKQSLLQRAFTGQL